MSAPDARRAPQPQGARSDQPTPRQLDLEAKRTPALGRLSWNGHAGLTPTYARHIGWLDDETTKVLRLLLRDREGGALAIFDAIGPRAARAVAYELLSLSQEVPA